MADELRNGASDGADEESGLRFEELSGSQFADSADAELVDESASEATPPISEGKIIDEAELLNRDDPIVETRPRAPRSFNRRHIVQLVILAGVVALLFWAMSKVNSSGVNNPGPEPVKEPQITKKDVHMPGTANSAKGKGSKTGKKKDLPNVILIPPTKDKPNKSDKGSNDNSDSSSPYGPGDSLVETQLDPHIAAAIKILKAKKYPASYRSRPGKLADYLSKHLDYPVVTELNPDRSNVLGIAVIDFLGDVMLTNRVAGEQVPDFERVHIWPERDINDLKR